METEFEIKFLDINEKDLVSQLKRFGGKKVKSKTLMKRQVFHFDPTFTKEDKWARVRDEGDKITMSIKHIIDANKIDGTKEVELIINKFPDAIDFLVETGLIPTSYQENYRETWEYMNCKLTIDTWPGLSPFVEIEGDSEKIVREVVKKFGFDFETGEYGSIDLIYVKKYGIKREVITKAEKLTFENYPKILGSQNKLIQI